MKKLVKFLWCYIMHQQYWYRNPELDVSGCGDAWKCNRCGLDHTRERSTL